MNDNTPRRRRWTARLLALALTTGVLPIVLSAPAQAGTITSRGAASAVAYESESTTTLTATVPDGAQPGDLLLTSLGFGMTTAKHQPTLTAPAGWTLASRTNHSNAGTLAIYWHILGGGETSYAWTSNVPVGGTVVTAAFGGADPTRPLDVSKGRDVGKGTSFATPSAPAAVPGETVVASYFGYVGSGTATTWTPPAGMTELGDLSNGSRSGSEAYSVQATAGPIPAKTAATSVRQDYALATLTALRPAAGPANPPAITDVQASSPTATSILISWTSDHPADTQIDYGPTTAYGSTSLDPAMVTNHMRQVNGLAPNTTYHYRVRSTDGAHSTGTSLDGTFKTGSNGAVPLIVDTDIFSSADDVGALAIAFALQQRGEANVLAINVDTRLNRPAVTTNSWRCAAAIAQFYGSAATPIGSAMPDDGTEINTDDFIGPCSTLASSSTPAPDPAVSVYRRALAGQADGKVVIASTGYLQNLAALLDSPPDSISPMSGRDLVTHKVRSLVVMGGGYPSGAGENNLAGDGPSSQYVAANWPTKIVWSGEEVGDAVHSGDTLARTQPANSPVRVSYDAFVGPGNWYYSYDLTAVYHAVRPTDPLLTEVGPGTNTVTSTGSNQFTAGAGKQYYLKLTDATGLDVALESLLDAVPPQ